MLRVVNTAIRSRAIRARIRSNGCTKTAPESMSKGPAIMEYREAVAVVDLITKALIIIHHQFIIRGQGQMSKELGKKDERETMSGTRPRTLEGHLWASLGMH